MRNVEATVYDNDTPGIFVTQIAPGCVVLTACVQDGQTLVIEGANFGPVPDYTGRSDDLLIQLAMQPQAGDTIRVKLLLDAASQSRIDLTSTDPFHVGSRFHTWAFDGGIAHPELSYTYYTIDFTSADWETPVLVHVNARNDDSRQDPTTAVIRFARDDDNTDLDGTKTVNAGGEYVFPNLRSGAGLTPVRVVDDETADVVAIESGTSSSFSGR